MAYIVDNAPIPLPTQSNKGKSKWPFVELKIGQSFMVPNRANMPPGEKLGDSSTYGNMATHVSRQNRLILPDRKFRCRIYPDDKTWIQVWREK